MLRKIILASALMLSPALAVTVDMSATVGRVIDTDDGYRVVLFEPASRVCYMDPEAWAANLNERGFTDPAIALGYGTNPLTGEYVFALGVVDPETGEVSETWAIEDGSDLLCLHAVTYKLDDPT